jgi:hypothetical protein
VLDDSLAYRLARPFSFTFLIADADLDGRRPRST